MGCQELRTEEVETWESAGTRRLLFWRSRPPGRVQLGFLSSLGGLLESSMQRLREGVAFLRVPQTGASLSQIIAPLLVSALWASVYPQTKNLGAKFLSCLLKTTLLPSDD